MVSGPDERPGPAILAALRLGPGTLRTIAARLDGVSPIALRLALHRLVKEGAVVPDDRPATRVYRLASDGQTPMPQRSRPLRLTPVRLDHLRLVAAAAAGMPEGSGIRRRMRVALEAAGLLQLLPCRCGPRGPAERRWFITEAGRLAIAGRDRKKAA